MLHTILTINTSYIVNAARLIAPALDPTSPPAGFDWCIAQAEAANLTSALHELGLAKAMQHMKGRDIQGAVGVLKEYEAKGGGMKGAAAANLAFLAVHEGDVEGAKAFAETAVESD